MNRDRESEVGRPDNNVADAADAARDAKKRAPQPGDDRGGSRDGEGREAGDPGDREQLDNDGGRPQSRR